MKDGERWESAWQLNDPQHFTGFTVKVETPPKKKKPNRLIFNGGYYCFIIGLNLHRLLCPLAWWHWVVLVLNLSTLTPWKDFFPSLFESPSAFCSAHFPSAHLIHHGMLSPLMTVTKTNCGCRVTRRENEGIYWIPKWVNKLRENQHDLELSKLEHPDVSPQPSAWNAWRCSRTLTRRWRDFLFDAPSLAEMRNSAADEINWSQSVVFPPAFIPDLTWSIGDHFGTLVSTWHDTMLEGPIRKEDGHWFLMVRKTLTDKSQSLVTADQTLWLAIITYNHNIDSDI